MTPPDEAERAAELEAARRLFAAECQFLTGAASLASLPPPGPPELAFAGRSNVGKSSLVNALTGRTTLARVSNTPGRTQQINFFDLGPGRLRIVDLPGYGYAKVAKAVVEDWTELILSYLKGRVDLRRVALLVDSRHGLKANDREVMTLLDQAGVPYRVVLTKADKLRGGELTARMTEVSAALRKHPAAFPHVLATSAETKEGIPELRASLADLALGG